MSDYKDEDEVILTDLARNIVNLLGVIKKQIKWIIPITGVLAITCGVLVRKMSDAKYVAVSTFLFEGNENAMPSGLGNMASMLGLGGMGGGMDEDKLAFIIQTNKIVGEAFHKRAKINGKDDLLINHYVREYKLNEKWCEKFDYACDIDFNDQAPQLDSLRNVTILMLKKKMGIKVSGEGVISLRIESKNKELSTIINKNILDAVIVHFNRYSAEKDKKTYSHLQSRVDSIKNELSKIEMEYAKILDNSMMKTRAIGKIDEYRLKREIEILSIMYSEGVKNIELAKFNVLNNSKIIQILDTPNSRTLKDERKGLIFNLVLFSMLFAFISVGFVVSWHYTKVILKEVKNGQ